MRDLNFPWNTISAREIKRCRVITGTGNTDLANQRWEIQGTSWLVEMHIIHISN